MTDAPRRGRGRPRREGADEEILSVTVELLREKGYRELTFDAVTERTGIAKTTIYRRWPSKAALVAAAIAPLESCLQDPAEIVRETASVLNLLETLDADAVEVMRAVIAPRLARLREMLGDSDEAEARIGALVVRMIAREPVDS